LADLKRSSSEHKSRKEKRVRSRQPSLSESFKRRRVVSESGDEGEHDGACLASISAPASHALSTKTRLLGFTIIFF
jgi:hypothetical protein